MENIIHLINMNSVYESNDQVINVDPFQSINNLINITVRNNILERF